MQCSARGRPRAPFTPGIHSTRGGRGRSTHGCGTGLDRLCGHCGRPGCCDPQQRCWGPGSRDGDDDCGIRHGHPGAGTGRGAESRRPLVRRCRRSPPSHGPRLAVGGGRRISPPPAGARLEATAHSMVGRSPRGGPPRRPRGPGPFRGPGAGLFRGRGRRPRCGLGRARRHGQASAAYDLHAGTPLGTQGGRGAGRRDRGHPRTRCRSLPYFLPALGPVAR